MFVNSRLKTNQIIGQSKALYRQRNPETVDIDILVKSRNGDRKIMRSRKSTPAFSKMIFLQEQINFSGRDDFSGSSLFLPDCPYCMWHTLPIDIFKLATTLRLQNM